MSLSQKSETGPSCEFQQNIELLRQIDFFSSLPMEALKVFAYLCERESYHPGEELMAQDEDSHRAIYIISGRAQLQYRNTSGVITIREYEADTFLGGLNLLGELRSLFAVKALTDLQGLVLTREKFSPAMEQFPELMPKILRAMVRRIRQWEGRMVDDLCASGATCSQNLGVTMI